MTSTTRITASVLINLIFYFIFFMLGREVERAKIAGAIRSGRLSVIQRVESIAQQIESGNYPK